jgi:hypothetical protein
MTSRKAFRIRVQMQACRSLSRLYAERKRLGATLRELPCVFWVWGFSVRAPRKKISCASDLSFVLYERLFEKNETRNFESPKGSSFSYRTKPRNQGNPIWGKLGYIHGAVRDWEKGKKFSTIAERIIFSVSQSSHNSKEPQVSVQVRLLLDQTN